MRVLIREDKQQYTPCNLLIQLATVVGRGIIRPRPTVRPWKCRVSFERIA